MNDLLYSVGLDITDLKTSAKVAKEQAEDIKRGFKGFKDVIEFGGVGVAVLSFFRGVINYAQEAKGPIDENTAAVRRFGNSLDEANVGAKSWGAQLVGIFNRSGEGWGMLLRSLIDGRAAVGALIQQERDQAQERQKMEEEKKRHGQEYQKIAAEILSLENEATRLAYSQLTTQEQFNQSAQRFRDIAAQIESFTGTTIERRRLELQLQQASVEVLKADAELTKESATAAKKRDEEATKAAEQHIVLQDKLYNLRYESLRTEERIVILEQSRASINDAIEEAKQQSLDTTKLEIAMLENTVELEKERTVEIERQAKLRQAQAETEKKARADEAFAKSAKPIIGTAIRTPADFANASEDALSQLVYRNRRDAHALRSGIDQNNYDVRLEAGRLEAEAANADGELRLRQRVRSAYEMGGTSGVYSALPNLDPLVIDRLITQFATQHSTNEKALLKLSTIEERVTKFLK